MGKLLLVDINSVGYANQFSHTLTAHGMEVQAISGTLRSLSKQLREHPDYLPVILWDNKAQWRHDLFNDYKSNRLKSETSRLARASYKKQLPYLQTLLGKLGFVQLSAKGAEADDLGYQLIRVLLEMGHEVRLLTSDTDWLQGLQPGVSWLDPRKDKLISNNKELEAHVGTPDPRRYLEAKALEGDKSDSIPGIYNVGIKKALKVFSTYGGSMYGFYQALANNNVDLSKKVLASLASEEGQAIFKRNMQLMDLSLAPTIHEDELIITHESVDSVVVTDWAEHFSFQFVLKDVGAFMEPFENSNGSINHNILEKSIKNLGFQL